MKKIIQIESFIQRKQYLVVLFILLTFSFIIRAYNLNYNSPFNDEAIYVVVGKLGLFKWDWGSYNPRTWIGGFPFLYPALSALSYSTGGIVGSRLLNVLFGVLNVECIFLLTALSGPLTEKKNIFAGIVAATIVAGSSVGIYVSRIATYDMPSIYFLFLSILLHYRAEKRKENIGKWFFYSSLAFDFAILIKMTAGIYLLFFLAFSYFRLRSLSKTHIYYWKRYFVVPVLGVLIIYSLYNLRELTAFSSLQSGRIKTDFMEIFKIFFTNSMYIWPLWILGSVGMFWKKNYKQWAFLNIGAFLILIIHLVLRRSQSLDKHTFLTVSFLAPMIGIGISSIVYSIRSELFKKYAFAASGIVLIVYCILSYKQSLEYNYLWEDSTKMLNHLNKVVQKDDKVLSEVGAAGILATYDKNLPQNTATFDWFTYQGIKGDKAYEEAVKNGYFDVIEIKKGDKANDDEFNSVHKKVKNNISSLYQLAYNEGGYLIYRKNL